MSIFEGPPPLKSCKTCGHSDEKDIIRKAATQERIRLLRRVVRKLLNNDKAKIAEHIEDAA